MKTLLLSAFLLLFSNLLYSQVCDCSLSLSKLITEVEANYVGYSLIKSNKTASKYRKFKSSLLRKSKKMDKNLCLVVLDEYISFFSDNHFGVIRRGNRSFLYIKDSIQNNIPQRITEKLVGCWKDRANGLHIRIEKSDGALLGIVVSDKRGYSKKDDVLFRIFYVKGKLKFFYFYHSFFYQCVYSVVLKKKNILVDGGSVFEYCDQSPNEMLSPTQVSDSCHIRNINDHVVYFRIPSFDHTYRTIIDSLVRVNDRLIKASMGMILDIRDNSGGSVESTFSLVKYFYTGPIHYPDAFNIASDSAISSIQKILRTQGDYLSNDVISYFTGLEKTMKANRGALIKDTSITIHMDSILERPGKVIILVNSGTASSAELFLLAAKQSRKVTVIGTNTAGAMDFGWPIQHNICNNYRVTIPAQMASHTLIKRYDKVGIKPDVFVHEEIEDWVEYAINYLKNVREK